jgi:hypothetical protein
LNGLKPPTDLTGGMIYIDPVIDGECVLNGTQHVRDGNKVIVIQGKKLRVNGELKINN